MRGFLLSLAVADALAFIPPNTNSCRRRSVGSFRGSGSSSHSSSRSSHVLGELRASVDEDGDSSSSNNDSRPLIHTGTRVPSALLAGSLMMAALVGVAHPEPANAVLGAGGAVVSSPAIVKSITLDQFLALSENKQRQYEGGFLSCQRVDEGTPAASPLLPLPGVKGKRPVAVKKVCKPTNLIDGLLAEIDVLAETNPEKAEIYNNAASNLMQRQRFLDRQRMEAALGKQPELVYFGAAFLASCVATSIMHPLDTLKVRLMSGKGGDDEEAAPGTSGDGGDAASAAKGDDANPLAFLGSLYDGLLPNLLKEGPASALYLGVYEVARTRLETVPFFAGKVLLVYLLAGSVGELVGSVVRSPAEAVKTRVQAGLYDVPGAVNNVFLTPEGRKNTFFAWSAGVFRDVPHGAILIATFEVTKTLIVDSSLDVDVNTLLSEALLGGLGGGLGALVSTPSDVVTTKIITAIEDGGEPPNPVDTLAEVWNTGGVRGLFSGVTERVGYWTLSYGIFLSVYCSMRQYALVLFK